MRGGEIDLGANERFLTTDGVTLEFDVEMAFRDLRFHLRQSPLHPASAVRAPASLERSLDITGEKSDLLCDGLELVPGDRGGALRRPQLRPSEQTRDGTITLARFHEERDDRSVLHRQFRPDDGAEAVLFGPLVEPD